MTDAASKPWPTELRLSKGGKALTIVFDSGETFELGAEYLRVRSPSAEVQGHSPDERKTVNGDARGAGYGKMTATRPVSSAIPRPSNRPL